MKHLFAIAMSVCMLLPSLAWSESTTHVDKAKSSTTTWLAITDSLEYASSWEQTAELFQKAVPKQNWQSQLEKTRLPLGAVKSREFKVAETARVLPGVPEGQYVVLQYETQFEKSPKMIETVTSTLDGDGTWKVVGYYIKQAK
ncbi:DUF4019 domain-containing protein [Azomonas macrocytogenes]|uniref:DUF4019 domain-containing protein n=1 Tax=Azomonas macrocytogenes TaxID=69962 RepID=A0A839T530_AZOMA|nr:DUF4019 domain-containing protein [Azomonas macrocytogenes]MBB3104552.1 hypothetical protein [Azomonas macrocytogenes]